MIGIVDYGVGNLFSLSSSLKAVNIDSVFVRNTAELKGVKGLILPGVGAYGQCMQALASTGLVPSILNLAKSGFPIMGICVGMQLLSDFGEEFGKHQGLGLIHGAVRKITPKSEQRFKVPLIGWKNIKFSNSFGPISEEAKLELAGSYYFVHSYAFEPEDGNDVLATYQHGDLEIVAAIGRRNLIGTQFHPEKSGPLGLIFLEYFSRFALSDV